MSEENADSALTWSRQMGIVVVKATVDEVVAELVITEQHRQAQGIVHGGVHSGFIESVTSLGATLLARARNQAPPVGLENHTSFVKAASEGRLRATAKPITRGRTTQLWEATVTDEKGDVVATGRVRLLCREAK
jgi:uncharacterized protein (TIGR00369 family)